MEKEERNSATIRTMHEIMSEFNKMYNLPVSSKPTLLEPKKLKHFIKLLKEEVKEGEDILEEYEACGKEIDDKQKIEILTNLADWMGDLVWYIHSESLKYGIDMGKTLHIIKESNLSKINTQGNPIPAKPQTKIRELLEKQLNQTQPTIPEDTKQTQVTE